MGSAFARSQQKIDTKSSSNTWDSPKLLQAGQLIMLLPVLDLGAASAASCKSMLVARNPRNLAYIVTLESCRTCARRPRLIALLGRKVGISGEGGSSIGAQGR